ncbi:MAG: 30S ribosomal protein S12 methylthiotransferase RimO [Armatimonadetes bacterium]|nr:30S ribosomal protein S12 methylthiotransferase RimO [Candidatus Hippobium faecium]
MNKSYNISAVSLGCAKNQYDLEASLADLITEGHQIVYDFSDADIIIINTCSFIESARQETRENIDEAVEAKKDNPDIKIIVCGCYPQKFKDEMLELYGDYIDAYCGIEMHKYITDIIHQLPNFYGKIEKTGTEWYEPKNGRLNTLGDFTGNIKISEGCNNRCSYCAIPSIRGTLRSRLEEYILREAENMSQSGIMELNVIAQDITAYGKDFGKKDALSELLKKMNDLKGSLQWIRLLYAYPTEITDNLIDTIKNCQKVVKYLDIPLQHGDNTVLGDMNRRGTAEEYLETIQKLRDAVPNICLRSTFIVGYPTETDKAFENLIDFVKKAQFDRAGFFTYSREINTPAYSIETSVPENIITERAEILGKVLEEISLNKNNQLLNRKLDVLCEDRDDRYIYGRTYRDAIDIDGYIKIKTKKNLTGKIIKNVTVTKAHIYDLEGKLTD